MGNTDILILNVDDSDAARYVKTHILKGAGYQVAEANNGTDAVAFVKKLLPALVLLDVKLPDISGIEVCRQIKADQATRNVLVLQTSAALTGRDDKIRGLEGGADNYLAPPVEADELLANVKALLRLQRTQAELRNSEERFRQLTDNIEDVFWMFGLGQEGLLYVSEAYEPVWGRSREQLRHAPQDWFNAIHVDDRSGIERRWQALRQGEHYDQEYRLCQPDGKIRWVRDRGFLVRDANDAPYRIARITSDITHRKQMERLLHSADENKNAFLATLAHELRNPLSPIRNAVALIEESGPGQPAVHAKARQVIVRQVNHLSRLVDDLLDVARISEGKLSLRLQPVELGALLAPALETVKPLMESRAHRMRMELPSEPVWLHGDPLRLAQVLGNLLQNAAKFTHRNGEITLVATLTGQRTVCIAVHDNGIGIASLILPTLFDMFTQGGAAYAREHDGLGIGLSLVAALARMHGGSVRAQSPGVNHGSTFILELPLLDPERVPD